MNKFLALSMLLLSSGAIAWGSPAPGEYLMRVTFEGRTVEQEVKVAGATTVVRLKEAA